MNMTKMSVLQEIEVLICTKKSGPRETSQNVYDEHETGSLANRERLNDHTIKTYTPQTLGLS